jgi:hypothetical protein
VATPAAWVQQGLCAGLATVPLVESRAKAPGELASAAGNSHAKDTILQRRGIVPIGLQTAKENQVGFNGYDRGPPPEKPEHININSR